MVVNSIKERREALGLTQQEIADRACVTRSWIASLENGLVDDIKLTTADRISTALGYTGKDRIQKVFQVQREGISKCALIPK